jgi:hypothetical protein
MQSDGKSEYYGFDRALSIKRKISIGLSLEEQLRDDPRYAGMTHAEIEKEVRECERKFLEPLVCVDIYLRQFRRDGQYRLVSSGMSDPEGRWQAFIDYSNVYHRHFRNPKRLIELGIEEDEIGEIEEAAFDIIRLRHLPDLPKVHVIMRDLPKYCRTKEGKKEIKKIAKEVDPVLPREECFDSQGNPLSAAEVDVQWAAKHQKAIIYHTKNASKCHEKLKEKETPIELLEAALKKLTHDDMDVSAIAVEDFRKAMKLAAEIKGEANDIESQIYHQEKDYKRLVREKE